jgi:hypothetical protein
MGILALSALVVAGTGFWLFTRSLPGFKLTQKKVQKDLESMESDVRSFFHDPVKLDKNDLEILSYNVKSAERKKIGGKKWKATITSIFEEPVAGVSYRRYNKKNALMVILTHQRAFYYWEKEKDVSIVIDDQVLGSYQPANGYLIGQRTGKMIAKLDKSVNDRHPLIIQGEEVASVKIPKSSDLIQRVFDYTGNNLSAEEEAILLGLVLFEVAKQADSK